ILQELLALASKISLELVDRIKRAVPDAYCLSLVEKMLSTKYIVSTAAQGRAADLEKLSWIHCSNIFSIICCLEMHHPVWSCFFALECVLDSPPETSNELST